MVDTEPKFEWRFVCYHEHEYYGVLIKNSLSKYVYIMIVFGEDKPSKEWCHRQISKLKGEDINKVEPCLAKVRLKGELIKDAPDDVFTVVEISRTDDGECISFQQLNSSENKHDLVMEMHTYDIETGAEKFYEYEEKEDPGFFRKLLNFIIG